MARRDKTFSSEDIIRFYVKNLTLSERKDVISVFYVAVFIEQTRESTIHLLLSLVGLLLRAIPGGGQLLRLLLRIFRIRRALFDFEDFRVRAGETLKRAGLDVDDLIEAVLEAARSE